MTKVDSLKLHEDLTEVHWGKMMKHAATFCHTAMQNRVTKVASWCHCHYN